MHFKMWMLAVAAALLSVCPDSRASPTSLTQPNNDIDDASLREALSTITERLSRWEALMGRLEPRLSVAATALGNMDANIRNLQERAHVWDTFQLHVAAWNDQIQSLHHKMNIINEGYGKLAILDNAVSSALHPNGTIAAILQKLAAMETRIDGLVNALAHEPAPFVSEFAGRGLLHTIRALEKKMTHMQMAFERSVYGQKQEVSDERDDLNGEFKCSTSSDVEDLLQDVASKVDRILEEGQDRSVAPGRHGCRRLSAPQKKLMKDVEYLRSFVQDLVAEESDLVDTVKDKASLRQRRRLPLVGAALQDITDNIERLARAQQRNINENEALLRRIDRKVTALANDDDIEELVRNKFRKIEKKLDDIIHDDSDEDDDDKRRKKNRSDDDDDDDDDSDDKRRKKNRSDDDSDDDDDDDDSNDNDRRRKKNRSDNDSDDDDDDDDSNDNDRRRKKNRSDNDSDDDDDDDSDDNDKRRKKNRSDDDSDDDDDDDSDDNDKRRKKNRSDNDSDDDDDDDDSDDNDRRRKKNRSDNDSDDDDDDDSDDNDKRRKKNRSDNDSDDDDDDSDDNDRRRKKKKSHDNDTDEDDDDDDSNDNDKRRKKNRSDNDSDDDDDSNDNDRRRNKKNKSDDDSDDDDDDSNDNDRRKKQKKSHNDTDEDDDDDDDDGARDFHNNTSEADK